MAGLIKAKRLAQLAKELNVGHHTIVEHLAENGIEVENKPTTKLTEDMVSILLKDFQKDKHLREKADKISIGTTKREEVELEEKKVIGIKKEQEEDQDEVFIQGVTQKEEPEAPAKEAPAEEPAEEEPKAEEPETPAKEEEKPAAKLSGPKVLGKIDLTKGKEEEKPEEEAEPEPEPAAEAEPEPDPEPKADVEEAPATDKEASEAPAKEEEPAAEAAPEKEEAAEEPAAEQKAEEKPAAAAEQKEEDNHIPTKKQKLDGPKVVGKIDLPVDEKKKKTPVASSSDDTNTERKKKKRRRKRIYKDEGPGRGKGRGGKKQRDEEREISEKEIEEKLKETMSKIAGGGSKGKSARSKRKRSQREEKAREMETQQEESNVLELTEFISVSELASLMNVTPTEVIMTCMNLGTIVSINQRLDAEVIELVAEEYGFEVKFISVEEEFEEGVEEEEDDPADLQDRSPIVTIMGHVDHGKTSLLDYIRSANVVAGEKGGITQHIGAYEVETGEGKTITFLDTPGHEAFTAMRARGAKITDVAVIVVAADDSIMPQTKEAISHAQAAGVPIVFAINKVDKPTAQPEKIKEELANMNLLVEEWGGKYQSQDLSAKTGEKVDSLLEKILLEAELLELKANPDKPAIGSVIEASLDKGRGYVANILVQEGTLRIGDFVLAGSHVGKVKAMFNERGQKVTEAGPSSPVQVLGLDGAPQAGEKVKVYLNEQEAKNIANKRAQIEREQGMRTQKHITLDEIGRRLALGNFKELNIILKGDVDGSVEALSDALLKLSTEEIQINIVHKAVGAITESDVLLASASDAVIIGFQVRPSVSARKLAEKEDIEIRLYSVIYDAIEEVKMAMEGMLEPKIEEKILGNAEIRETFKITKVGTVAGCYVTDGKILRNAKIRLVREGIVIYSGELASLKRFKEDVKEVKTGFECGLNIKDFNDIKVGDVIEAYEEVEVKRTL